MTVSQSTPTWQVNILKGIASLLQVDVTGVNKKKSSMNLFSNNDDVYSVYKTMEVYIIVFTLIQQNML